MSSYDAKLARIDKKANILHKDAICHLRIKSEKHNTYASNKRRFPLCGMIELRRQPKKNLPLQRDNAAEAWNRQRMLRCGMEYGVYLPIIIDTST